MQKETYSQGSVSNYTYSVTQKENDSLYQQLHF